MPELPGAGGAIKSTPDGRARWYAKAFGLSTAAWTITLARVPHSDSPAASLFTVHRFCRRTQGSVADLAPRARTPLEQGCADTRLSDIRAQQGDLGGIRRQRTGRHCASRPTRPSAGPLFVGSTTSGTNGCRGGFNRSRSMTNTDATWCAVRSHRRPCRFQRGTVPAGTALTNATAHVPTTPTHGTRTKRAGDLSCVYKVHLAAEASPRVTAATPSSA